MKLQSFYDLLPIIYLVLIIILMDEQIMIKPGLNMIYKNLNNFAKNY